jgi:hypothetical protein
VKKGTEAVVAPHGHPSKIPKSTLQLHRKLAEDGIGEFVTQA